MARRRRSFRPEVDSPLEIRLVLSTVSPKVANIERTLESGAQIHPTVTVTDAGSGQVKVLKQGGKALHGELTFSTRLTAITSPNSDGTGAAYFKVQYHNESKVAISSAILEEKLGAYLNYMNAPHTPSGGTVTVTGTGGPQTLELNLPNGIAAGAEGYFEFEAEYKL